VTIEIEGERLGQAFDTCDAKYLPAKIILVNQRIPAKSYEEVIANLGLIESVTATWIIIRNDTGKIMETIYQLNADDLNEDFLEGLKASFKHKEIEIVVYERDETAYLLRSAANRAKLLQAVADIDQNQNLVTPDQEQFQ